MSKGTVTEVVEAPATVVARASASVTAPATGTIAELKVKDGQRVTKGQVLFRVDSPSARSALTQARQADRQAGSGSGGLAVPQIDLTALSGSDDGTEQAFAGARSAASTIPDPKLRADALARIAAAEADYRAARASTRRTLAQVNAGLSSLGRMTSSLAGAQRAQTRAAVQAAQSSVEALTVRAPIGGTVIFGGTGSAGVPAAAGASGADVSSALSQLPSGVQGQAQSLLSGSGGGASTVESLEVGMPVTSGSTLLTITDTSTLTLRASVDETDVLLVKPGVAADVELDAVPGATYAGSVRSVDLQPTTSSRGGVAYTVRLTLGAGTGEDGAAAPTPRPGMSAVARLKVRTATDAMSVPTAAIFRDGGRDAVWLVDDGVAHRHEVVLGAQGDDLVQVASGLELGQQVVVKGADRVTDGERVVDR